MKLEEACNNIGAEVELDESTKPYTFISAVDNLECKKSNNPKDGRIYVIDDIRKNGNVVIKGNMYDDIIHPRHLKLKPQNYKIHVPTEEESREAQELFFELGYRWQVANKYIVCTDIPYIYTYSDIMEINVGWNEKLYESYQAKKITLQELRDMVAKKKGIKSIGVDLASGEDKTVKSRIEPRKEMTWEDALRAVADGKEVETLDIHNQWENIKEFYMYGLMEKGNRFRLAPQRITLNGEYTKEELLQKIGEME